MEKRHAFFPAEFRSRDGEDGTKHIEGYFAVYNSKTKLWPGWTEQIAQGAFDRSLEDGDIRALFNHNTDLVLGRSYAKTLVLRSDAHGLWGDITINEADTDALNAYARVQRGDITGCSFGFYPREETYEDLPNGDVICTIKDVELFEVSVCAFPAYEATEINARKRDHDAASAEKRSAKLEKIKKKLEALK